MAAVAARAEAPTRPQVLSEADSSYAVYFNLARELGGVVIPHFHDEKIILPDDLQGVNVGQINYGLLSEGLYVCSKAAGDLTTVQTNAGDGRRTPNFDERFQHVYTEGVSGIAVGLRPFNA